MKVIAAITVRILYEHKIETRDPRNWNLVKIFSRNLVKIVKG